MPVTQPMRQYAPPGTVAAFAGSNAPAGWLKCAGQAVSRATYGALFAYIGTTYGAGDGSTTFNVPDMRGEFPRGADDGRGVDAGRAVGSAQGDAIRNIVGQFTLPSEGAVTIDGVFEVTDISGDGVSGSAGAFRQVKFDASRVVPTSAENRPRNVALLYCIKT